MAARKTDTDMASHLAHNRLQARARIVRVEPGLKVAAHAPLPQVRGDLLATTTYVDNLIIDLFGGHHDVLNPSHGGLRGDSHSARVIMQHTNNKMNAMLSTVLTRLLNVYMEPEILETLRWVESGRERPLSDNEITGLVTHTLAYSVTFRATPFVPPSLLERMFMLRVLSFEEFAKGMAYAACMPLNSVQTTPAPIPPGMEGLFPAVPPGPGAPSRPAPSLGIDRAQARGDAAEPGADRS